MRERILQKTHSLQKRCERGRNFEKQVLAFLESQGYRRLGMNLRIVGVEVDLLVESRDGREILLVEAKFRSGAARFDGVLISRKQYGRLLRVLQRLRQIYPLRQVSWALAYRNPRGDVEFVSNPCYF